MLKAVLFDLDGTLLDTAPDFIFCVNRLREEEGLTMLDSELIRRHVSNGATAMTKLVTNEAVESASFDALRNRLLALYETHLADQTRLFPGLDALLSELESHQIAWGVVTNKPRRYTVPLLAQLDLGPRCATVVCPDDVTHRKPHPEPLFLACRHVGCAPAEAIYVGDHLRDIDSGKAAAMRTVAAAYGYIDENDDPHDWQADWLTPNVDALHALIRTLISAHD